MSKAQRTAPAANDAGGLLTSQRIDQLRELYAKLEDPIAQERRTDAEINDICGDVYAISDDIMRSPVPGLVGIIEHAMAVHYWFRPDGSCAVPGPDVESVQSLVKAVLALADGGDHRAQKKDADSGG